MLLENTICFIYIVAW